MRNYRMTVNVQWAQLRAELNALRGMFSQAMDVIGQLKRQIREIEKEL